MVAGTMKTDWTTASDGAVLRRYARFADAEAFEVLVHRYGSMVLATCRRALAVEADAEDAAQETFFKLARSAATVKSNVAAWLHRCAIGTSVDLVRKANVRARAESAAAATGDTSAVYQSLEWRDLEPIIDRVISELAEADRDLIVARYLAGRSQAELARTMGLAEGTVSRRLAKAINRFRTQLAAAGSLAVAASTTAGVIAALEAGSNSATVAPSLGASLAKIGISGVGAAKPAVAWTAGKAIAAGTAVATIGTAALVATQLRPPSTPPSAPPAAAATQATITKPGPAKPTGTIGPFQIVSASDESFGQRGIWITDRQMEIRHGYTQDGESVRTTLNIESVRVLPDDPKTTEIEERGVIRTRVQRILPEPGEFTRFVRLGRVVDISVGFDNFGRVVLDDIDDEVQIGRNEPRWFGVRPPVDWPESASVPDNTGKLGILGPWTESERVPVTITAEEIRFGTDSWAKERYRVISWEQLEGHSRILSVNGGGRDPRLIGTRFQLLLREDDNGYTVAYYPPGTKRAGTWPTSFEYSSSNPVRVVSFEKDGGS